MCLAINIIAKSKRGLARAKERRLGGDAVCTSWQNQPSATCSVSYGASSRLVHTPLMPVDVKERAMRHGPKTTGCDADAWRLSPRANATANCRACMSTIANKGLT